MSKATISFVDTSDGVLLTLNFDDDLPENPEDATEAQVQAMIAFQSFILPPETDEISTDFSENGNQFMEEPYYEEPSEDAEV